MTPQVFFMIIASIGTIGWLAIIICSPFWKHTDRFVIGIIIVLLAVIYSFLNFMHIEDVGGPTSFLTYDGVIKIFQNPFLVIGGYAHILALDLMVALWIKHNAARCGIPYWIVVLILLLSISFAPLGLLVYLFIRWIKTKQYFIGF